MTREEEIDQAKRVFHEGLHYDPRVCFEEGIGWADNHPKPSSWISVEDSLPEQDEEVIVLRDEFNTSYFYKISFAHIVDKTVCKDYNGWNVPDVVYWFPMPKIPKIGD